MLGRWADGRAEELAAAALLLGYANVVGIISVRSSRPSVRLRRCYGSTRWPAGAADHMGSVT